VKARDHPDSLADQGAPRAISAAERCAGKRIVPFAVPAAFTRTCSQVQLANFVQNAEAYHMLKHAGFKEMKNPKGGILAWADEVVQTLLEC
jgi:peroxiredoxin